MFFSTSMQESSCGLPDTNDLCLGLQSHSLTAWDRSQSTQDSDAVAQASTQSVLSLPSSSIRSVLGKLPPGFLPLDPIGSDPSEELSTPLPKTSQLGSRSSSSSDLDTSGPSSDSNHLSNSISNLHITPTVPFLPLSGVSKDPLEMGAGSQPDFDPAILAAVTSSLARALERLPGPSARPSWNLLDVPEGPFSIENLGRLNRRMAAVNEATCIWSGQLPPRKYENPIYSCKVFLGGVPWIITGGELIDAFRRFGFVSVQWPEKDGHMPKGYVYLVFESEKAVRTLLQACYQELLRPNGFKEYYFKMSRRKKRPKEVQVIPWVLTDSHFVRRPLQGVKPSKMTVFVGNLHGTLNAEALAAIMDDLFGGVVSACIDTDKYKYPIGSGRVIFNNQRSYMRAVTAAFVEIKTIKFTKKVQIDPYLEDSMCQVCNVQPGPFFCRDQICLKYFCHSCWYWQHSMEALRCHRLMIHNQNRDSS